MHRGHLPRSPPIYVSLVRLIRLTYGWKHPQNFETQIQIFSPTSPKPIIITKVLTYENELLILLQLLFFER